MMKVKFEKIDNLYSKGVISNPLEFFKICNFRQFEKNVSVAFDHPLTVLVGKNGSGKSTFLKLIKSIAKGRNPNDYFFETEWDNFNDQGTAEFQYVLNGEQLREMKTRYFDWVFSSLEQKLDTNKEIKDYLVDPSIKEFNKITDVEFKSLIGSFEKNTFFDNQTSKSDLKKKALYASRVTKKVQQSIETKSNNGKKAKSIILTESCIKIINYILGKDYDEVKIINHRFFSGTWGTSIIFKSGVVYSEANSGSGEFIVSNIVHQLSNIPSESLLLLDEPELSLHPGAQKRLFEYFLDLIISKKLQIILSTHSMSFVESIPSICIKNFVFNDGGKVIIEQGSNYLNAFGNLEISYDTPDIIVEDSLAKKVLEKVIDSENLTNQFRVNYYSGGASSIKTSLVTTFSKVGENNKYIIFDGDMYKSEVVDLSITPEIEKTTKYLVDEIKKITDVKKIDSFTFHPDGGKGGSNESQKKVLYEKYINYYKSRVSFLPKQIPEDIIYDRDYVLMIFSSINIAKVDSIRNSKEKFRVISDETNVSIEALYDLFTSYFVNNKKDSSEYEQISYILKKILSMSKDVH
ncbi:AAA family ATPase [Vibrio sp. 10N.286.48.B7]|uniref:AAA family ATPase n=1 Tax=Vibrio sp. 10N.286.48.B7 TaxID=1880853 RepID=UPI0039A53AF5